MALPGSILIATKVPEFASFEPSYTISYKKTRPHGGGALFLEMYLLQHINVRNSLPGISMNLTIDNTYVQMWI